MKALGYLGAGLFWTSDIIIIIINKSKMSQSMDEFLAENKVNAAEETRDERAEVRAELGVLKAVST
jgi:hypothetical protein